MNPIKVSIILVIAVVFLGLQACSPSFLIQEREKYLGRTFQEIQAEKGRPIQVEDWLRPRQGQPVYAALWPHRCDCAGCLSYSFIFNKETDQLIDVIMTQIVRPGGPVCDD